MPDSETMHVTAVAIGGAAVLIEGVSGAGKSDLALRLIDRGATLVSDDYTLLTPRSGKLIARPPQNLAGKMEVRGIGIVEVEHIAEIEVGLLVTISEMPPRMPTEALFRDIAGVNVPAITLPSLEPSAPIKVELAMKRALAP